MKKILCLVVMFCFLCTVQTEAATIDVAETSSKTVDSGGAAQKSRYTIPVSVVLGTPQMVRLAAPFQYGTVRDVNYDSSSDDCDMFFSESESDDNETSIGTFLYITGFGDGIREAFDPIYYRNNDSPPQDSIYVTIVNQSATATDNDSLLTVVYGRRGL